MDYCTVNDILSKVGVLESDIGSETLNNILIEAMAEVDKTIKTTCNPRTEFLNFTGNNSRQYTIQQGPLLTVKNIRISDTDITSTNYKYDKTGNILLLNTAEQFFIAAQQPNVTIKYVYGWLDVAQPLDTLNAIEVGTDTVELSDVENFVKGDWIRIVGMDGNEEWTQITSVDKDNSTITANFIYTHELGSSIYKGEVPGIIRKLTAVIGGIMGAVKMMGGTYNFATSYSVPDYTISKGEPYPAFVKILDDLNKEYQIILTKLPGWAVFS